jgi:glycosyltransferase involved in cell wall biosynthesis
LEKNSKQLFGYASGGYVRDQGIKVAKYDLIAICDDDDMWHESKLELQIYYMKKHNIYFSSSDAYLCKDNFRTNPNIHTIVPYQLYYNKHHMHILGNNGMLPEIFPLNFLERHNFVIHSTLLFSKELYERVGGYKSLRNGEEDWTLLREMNAISEHVYINLSLVYYEYK